MTVARDLEVVPGRSQNIIGQADYDLLMQAEAAREDRIQVDSFTLDEYMKTALAKRREDSPTEPYKLS